MSDKMNLFSDIIKIGFEKRDIENTIIQVDLDYYPNLIIRKWKYNWRQLLRADRNIKSINIDEVNDEEDFNFNNKNYVKTPTGIDHEL